MSILREFLHIGTNKLHQTAPYLTPNAQISTCICNSIKQIL